MIDQDEFAARSQLKWTREGDAWLLLYRRRRMGRVVPDKDRHVAISQSHECWLRRRLVEDRGVGERDVGRQTCLLIRCKSMRLAST